MDTKTPFQRACAACGTQAELLARVNANLPEDQRISPQAVSKWTKSGVPPERVLAVEAACNQAVTRYELRPDIFGTIEAAAA